MDSMIGTIATAAFSCMLFVSAALADESKTNETCDFVGQMADQVMFARQNNIPMSKVMALYSSSFEGEVLSLARKMVIAAYGEPSYLTEGAKAKQKADFRNSQELACYQALTTE